MANKNIHLQYVDKTNKDFIADDKNYKVLGHQAPTTFNIVFYKSSAEPNRVNKTNYLDDTHKLTLSGVLREQSSIINPSITIQHSGYPKYNYCYIASFERYYFIDNITSLAKDLWRIDMTCDVLMSFKTEIGNELAFVERNENEYDEQIIDSIRVPKAKKGIVYGTVTADSDYETWRDNYEIWHTSGQDTESFVAMIQGTAKDYDDNDVASKFGIARALLKASQLNGFIKELNDSPTIFQDKTIFDCLINLVAVPYLPTHETTLVKRYFLPSHNVQNIFNWSSSFIESIDDDTIDFVWNCTAQIQREEWIYHQCKYLIRFQPFGQFELDSQFLNFDNTDATNNVEFIIKVTLNKLTGDATLYYGTGGSNMYILTSCNVFQSIPYSSVKLDYTDLAKSTISTAASIIGGVSVPQALMSTAMNGLMGQKETQSNVNLGKMFIIDKKPTFKMILPEMTQISESIYGLPLYQQKRLKTLSGFTKVGEIHLEDIEIATRPELDNIERLLKQGVIL